MNDERMLLKMIHSGKVLMILLRLNNNFITFKF